MNATSRLIETLYASIRDGDPSSAASCYAEDAHFESYG